MQTFLQPLNITSAHVSFCFCRSLPLDFLLGNVGSSVTAKRKYKGVLRLCSFLLPSQILQLAQVAFLCFSYHQEALSTERGGMQEFDWSSVRTCLDVQLVNPLTNVA